ncbi:gluconeogenesis factor YvcK family protein [Bryobacter aggregatus]|uniref:gluconeogenesis factor YvcK family protein n=1 Tax=Bryobacter aggregatus TaxID=360054 RepID=UPI00068F2E3D|nr:uridine diphosphate-N-acetylglucosamine-binding protein YvcK [Bryobacter aggregatus]
MIAPPPGYQDVAGPLRIVSLGGGTGLSGLLHGLKEYARRGQVDITAIVTVTDDGGSSGRLRREFDILPPGDIRNCMVALSEDEALLGKLFQYRFSSGKGLKGHSFGNLFLTALTHVTGDFPRAVKVSSEVLAIYGRIYPSTNQNVGLRATMEDNSVIEGETKISKSRKRIRRLELIPNKVRPLRDAIEAIAAADLITMGPGSLYTSVIPNLLVDGIASAIRRAQATKAYFANLMWQPWETMQFSASDHLKAIFSHGGKGTVDRVILNTRPLSGAQRRRYAAEKVFPVEMDSPRIEEMGVQVVGRSLLARSEKVRHDADAIAAVALELAIEARVRRINLRGK